MPFGKENFFLLNTHPNRSKYILLKKIEMISLIFRWCYDGKSLISHFYQVDASNEKEFCAHPIENTWMCRKATWNLVCIPFWHRFQTAKISQKTITFFTFSGHITLCSVDTASQDFGLLFPHRFVENWTANLLRVESARSSLRKRRNFENTKSAIYSAPPVI
jgi:hypothetical protein